MLDILKESLTVAVSAFAGAWFAFLFQRRTSKLEREAADYASLREAHFAILQQHSQGVSLRDQILAAQDSSPAPWLTMLPILTFFDAPRLDVSKLLFMLEGPEPDLLNRLLVTQQKFFALQGLIEQRNASHTQLQDRLAALQREGVLKSAAPIEDIEQRIGQPLVGQIKTLTDEIFASYPSLIEFQQAGLSEIAVFSQRVFPERRVPKFELLSVDQRK